MLTKTKMLVGLSLCGLFAAGPFAVDDKPAGKMHSFDDNVKVTVTDTQLIVESDGIPNHETAEFPNRSNPNRILKQNYRFVIPRQPKRAERTTRLPMGPIGVAVNGIPFYNPYNAEGNDAVEGPFREIFDSCCGHPDQLGRYHYHKYPVCLKTPFRDTDRKHSPLIGYAFDGFAIYGPQGDDGKPPADLDECNGHEDSTRGYHYHVTAKFPYILGAYRGEIDPANLDRRGQFAGGRRAERDDPGAAPRKEADNPPRGRPGEPAGRPGALGPPPHPILELFDTDHDGVLSAAEIDAAPAVLRSLDANKDGKLTRDELPRPAPPRGRPERPAGEQPPRLPDR